MIYGYIRVSSDKQTVENQRFEIERFCKVDNMCIDGWIEETISGTKNYNKRQLGVLLKKVEKDDIIICSEAGGEFGSGGFMMCDAGTTETVTRTSLFRTKAIYIIIWTGHGVILIQYYTSTIPSSVSICNGLSVNCILCSFALSMNCNIILLFSFFFILLSILL